MNDRKHDDAEIRRSFQALREVEAAWSESPEQLLHRARERARREARPAPRLRWALAGAAALLLLWLGLRSVPDPLPPLDPARAGSLRATYDVLLETPGAALLRGIELELPPGPDETRRDSHRTNPNWRTWS